jgi:hypothetical protein
MGWVGSTWRVIGFIGHARTDLATEMRLEQKVLRMVEPVSNAGA